MPDREKISACIICCNEEQKIRRCLESVRWCDEIVVIDSFSTDRTVEICRTFTDRVVQHAWMGYVGQRNLVREEARYPWILYLDSDEEVSPGLRAEILSIFEKGSPKAAGFEFPRLVRYLGRWIRHGEWYPDLKLRLFRKELGRTEGIEPHDRVVVRGEVQRLRHPVFHYTYDDLSDHLDTVNRFSTITAQQKFIKGKRFNLLDALFRSDFHFFKGYVLRLGFRDGMHGFMVARLCTYGALMKYAKLREIGLSRPDAGGLDLSKEMDALNRLSSEQAARLFAQGRRFSLAGSLFRYGLQFFRQYVLRGDIANGFDGFIRAKLKSYESFIVNAKLWELGLRERGLASD